MLANLTLRKSSGLVKNQKGITLIELLAVIVILGIIAAIAVPAIGGMINKSRVNADKESYNIIEDAAIRYAMTEGILGLTGGELNIAGSDSLHDMGYLNSPPKAQSSKVTAFHHVVITESNGTYSVAIYSDSGNDQSDLIPDPKSDASVSTNFWGN